MGNLELKIHIALPVLLIDWVFSDSTNSRIFSFKAANGEVKYVLFIILKQW